MKISSSEIDIDIEPDQIELSSIKDSFHLVILGDSSVGKTSILERYCNDFFKREKFFQNSLIIYKKIYSYLNHKYLIKFWDPPNFIDNCNDSEINMFNNSDGFIYVCSYDNPDSLIHINKWYQFLTQYVDLSTKEMILLINKSDLKEENKLINEKQIEKKSKDLQLRYFEMSAKTGENVSKSINKFINKIIDKYRNNNKNDYIEQDNKIDSDNDKENDKDDGCLIL